MIRLGLCVVGALVFSIAADGILGPQHEVWSLAYAFAGAITAGFIYDRVTDR